jgi:pimeloyl-ACP methyl ester carboxylesterase
VKRLVLVHGFLGSALNWSPVVYKLKRHPLWQNDQWEITVPELLGHGRRIEKGEVEQINLKSVTEDLLSQIPPGPFFALGHSFGLRPLLLITRMEPGRIQALIAEDSSPVISERGRADIDEILTRIPVPFASRDAAKDWLDRHYGPSSSMSRFLLSHIRETNPGQHSWRFNAPKLKALIDEAHNTSAWGEWAQYPGPLGMILGGQSSFVPSSRLQECIDVRAGKRTEVVQIEQSGHWVHSDQPDLFVEALIKMVRDFEQSDFD